MFFDGDDYYERRRHHRDALERGKRNRETHRETENVQNVSREGKIRRHRRVDGVEGDLQAGALGASEEKKKKTIRVKSLLFAMEKKKTSRDGESYDDDSQTTTTTRDALRRDIADIAGGEEAKNRTEYYATAKVMKKLAGVENADGIDLVAELEMPEIREVTEFMMQEKRIEKVLCLDGVQDPETSERF